MIKLEFWVDENVLLEDLAADPAAEDLAVLQETYFVFPTRLNINGSEMFGLTKKTTIMYGGQEGKLKVVDQERFNPWISLPLLNWVWVGFERIRMACKGKETSYDLPGSGAKLIFVPAQDIIEIRSTFNGKIEWVTCQELTEAMNCFESNVYSFLQDRVPNMEQHPEWKKMLNNH